MAAFFGLVFGARPVEFTSHKTKNANPNKKLNTMRNRKTIAPKERKKLSHLVLHHLLTYSLTLQSKENKPKSFRETLNAADIKKKKNKRGKKIALSFRQASNKVVK